MYRRARRTFSEELGIEPGPRLQEPRARSCATTRRLNHHGGAAPRGEWTETVLKKRDSRGAGLALAAALGLADRGRSGCTVARLSDGSSVPVQLAGESVASSILEQDTIVGEIPSEGDQRGPPSARALSVGNRDDNTLLRIDARSLDVVRTIGLSVAPTDVELGAGSVWVLSDQGLLRVDPAINDVVRHGPAPPRQWPAALVPYGGRDAFVGTCAGGPGAVIRIDAATLSVEPVRQRPVWMIAYGEGALQALTGESDTSNASTRRRMPSSRASRSDESASRDWALSHGRLARVRSGCWPPRPCGGSIPRPSVSSGAFRSAAAKK